MLYNAFTTPPVWPGWRFAPLNALLHVQPPGFVIRWLLLDDHAPPRLVDEVRAAVASVAPRVLAARVREILTTDATDEFAACPCPVLYLRGVRDRLVPAAAVAQMTRARPDLACQELDGPHLLLQSRPAVAADAVGAFVRGLAAARGHEPS